MTTITRIMNWGEWRTVWLACGHRWKVRRDDLNRGQLYLGKHVDCTDCLYEELTKEVKR